MSDPGLPSLFIGSSVETLDVAYALQEGLDFDAEPTVWSQGIFSPTKSSPSNLLGALRNFAFSVFVFSPDDVVRLRGTEHRIVRDNVLFEFGLLVGKLGPDRCFYLIPRGTTDFRLPTDLLGTTALSYQANRRDGNLVAALGPACNQIRRAMRTLPDSSAGTRMPPVRGIDSYKAAWRAGELNDARGLLRLGVTDPYDEDWLTQKKAIQKVFVFLESVSEAVISGALDEAEAREAFGKEIVSFWPFASVALAPPNHVDDWWIPLPKMAELYWRWKGK